MELHFLILKWIKARHILVFISFFGCINVYVIRVNLSVAIVAMVNETLIIDTANRTGTCEVFNTTNSTDGKIVVYHPGEFDWDPFTRGVILSSFFYGYLLSQVIGGWLAERYGGKLVCGVGLFVAAVFTIITPPIARLGIWPLVVIRIIEGLGEGVTYPAIHSLLSRWVPPLERSKLASIAYAGSYVGIVLAFALSGILCEYGFAGGWPSVFYVSGMAGVVWFVFWMLLVYDTPELHPRITAEEKHYIETSIGKSFTRLSSERPPWLEMFKSLPVWAIIVAHTGSTWGLNTLMTNLPQYMNDVLGYKIKDNGVLSSLPYVSCWIVSILIGYVADYAIKHGISATLTRKFCTTFGLLGGAVSLIGVSYVGCNYVAAVVIFCVGMGVKSFAFNGFLINHLDIAPKYAGILFGISNTVGTIAGLLAPIMVGYFTQESSTEREWKKIFFIAAGIYAVSSLFYVVFGSGELQPWAGEAKSQKSNNENNIDTVDATIQQNHVNEMSENTKM